MFAFLALAAASVSDQQSADAKLATMARLYGEICIKTFPDDRAVDAIMAAKKARPLSPADVKITLGADPGRAWELADGSATVWLELPPYHACSVRWNSPVFGDLRAYRSVADAYERKIGGFAAADPYEADAGPIHVHAVGEQRELANGGFESLFIFDQQITDPKRRAAGETGYSLRFVHQFAPPPAK